MGELHRVDKMMKKEYNRNLYVDFTARKNLTPRGVAA